jgi:OOP family OmpA-OmpF porin
MTYLTNAGVSADRLRSVGYGETSPVADNGSNSGRAENRRVEFNIIDQDTTNCGQ